MAMDKVMKAVEILKEALERMDQELGVKPDKVQVQVLVFDNLLFEDIGEDIPTSGYGGAVWKRFLTIPEEPLTQGIDITFYGPRETIRK